MSMSIITFKKINIDESINQISLDMRERIKTTGKIKSLPTPDKGYILNPKMSMFFFVKVMSTPQGKIEKKFNFICGPADTIKTILVTPKTIETNHENPWRFYLLHPQKYLLDLMLV